MEASILMEIVNPHAAGVDIGSRSHWVAVGQSEQDVCEFGVFNQDWNCNLKVETFYATNFSIDLYINSLDVLCDVDAFQLSQIPKKKIIAKF